MGRAILLVCDGRDAPRGDTGAQCLASSLDQVIEAAVGRTNAKQ